jgi:hypothetical protein
MHFLDKFSLFITFLSLKKIIFPLLKYSIFLDQILNIIDYFFFMIMKLVEMT